MSWGKGQLEKDFAEVGIYPVYFEDNTECQKVDTILIDSIKEKVEEEKFEYYNYNFPTDGQIKTLNFITTYTEIVFKGFTKEQANKFIATYLDYAKEQRLERLASV